MHDAPLEDHNHAMFSDMCRENDAQKERIKELEIALIGTDDALFWLLNLLRGNSKGGPGFSPPNNAEWEGAIGQGKEAHEVAEKALGDKS